MKWIWMALTVFWVLMAIWSTTLTLSAKIPRDDKIRTFLWIIATMVWIVIAWQKFSLRE